METLEKAILFTSSRFDFTSELPDDDNAGNQLYGRDLAAWLCERLHARGLDAGFFDEDWGWQIGGSVAPGTTYWIGVYCLRDESGPGATQAPDWGLRLRASKREKWFWRLEKTVKVAVPPAVETAVLEAIEAIGASPRAWEDGPAG